MIKNKRKYIKTIITMLMQTQEHPGYVTIKKCKLIPLRHAITHVYVSILKYTSFCFTLHFVCVFEDTVYVYVSSMHYNLGVERCGYWELAGFFSFSGQGSWWVDILILNWCKATNYTDTRHWWCSLVVFWGGVFLTFVSDKEPFHKMSGLQSVSVAAKWQSYRIFKLWRRYIDLPAHTTTGK